MGDNAGRIFHLGAVVLPDLLDWRISRINGDHSTAFLALLSLQERLSYLVSGIRTTSSKLLSEKYGYPVVVAKANDRSFTGGATGSLWNPKILIPKYWIDTLTQDELSVMIARRACSINSLSRTGGVVLASLFLTAGVLLSFYLTVSLSGLDPVSSAGYASTMLWNALWSFLGLLILPSISRRSSSFVDRKLMSELSKRIVSNRASEPLEAYDPKTISSLLESALAKIEKHSDDEETRDKWIERIFHPIPARSSRGSRVAEVSGFGYFWHCLRTYLFFLWCCSGVLSRAVHCNVGKPDLWVYLPSD